jgi:hypothetical protein
MAIHRSALAVLGLGALVAMGTMSRTPVPPIGDVGSKALVAPPEITLGSTKTQSIPPSKPPTPHAIPPVRALPPAGTLPGN